MPRTVVITATTASSVAAAAVTVLQEQSATAVSQVAAVANASAVSHQLDKSEINDAVTKVLQGYDWTLVPIASK